MNYTFKSFFEGNEGYRVVFSIEGNKEWQVFIEKKDQRISNAKNRLETIRRIVCEIL